MLVPVNKNDEKGKARLERAGSGAVRFAAQRMFSGGYSPAQPIREIPHVSEGRRAYRFVNRLVYSTTATISISTIASG